MWGPAVGDIAEVSRYTQAAEGLLFQRAARFSGCAVKDVTKQPTHEGDFLYGGVDDNYFMTVALTPGASKIAYQPVTVPAAGRLEGSRAPARVVLDRAEGRRRAAEVFRGPEGLRRADGDRPQRGRARSTSAFPGHCRSAAELVEVDQRLRRRTTAGRSSS